MKNWNDVAKGQLVICFTVREVKETHTTEILDKTSWRLVYIYKFLHAEVKWEETLPAIHPSSWNSTP